MTPQPLTEGDLVYKSSGDYTFLGIVIGKIHKLSGAERYAVENLEGILHIFSDKQLISVTPSMMRQVSVDLEKKSKLLLAKRKCFTPKTK